MIKSTLFYNARLLDESMDTAGALLIVDSKIRSVFQGYFTNSETASKLAHAVLAEDGIDNNCELELFDVKGYTLTPSFIDMHVHMRYPGQTAKEDLNSGLHAAAAGGYGTVVAMPNTNPVVSSFETAMRIEQEASKIGLTHLFQTVSISKDFNGEDVSHIDDLDRKFIPVISEDGRDVTSSSVMLDGMVLAAKKGLIVSCHCEDPFLAKAAKVHREKALEMMNYAGFSTWGTNLKNAEDDPDITNKVSKDIDEEVMQANAILATAENVATIRNIHLAAQAECHLHVAHVSTKIALDEIRKAKPFMNITCEVTPHHIALEGTEQPYTRVFVNPPLRTNEDRIALIAGLRDGTVDVISTDHAPHTIEDKQNGAPGFPGLETSYAVCNTVLVRQNAFSAKRLSQLMSANPAKILGLQKGILKAGYDADLTIVNPEEEWIVDPSLFNTKGRATPYEGKTLFGKVHTLFIDGRKVFDC